MTPVVQQAGEPTDADRFKQLLDRFEAQLRYAYEHGGGHAGHMANAHATRKKIDVLLASRPQQPQAETNIHGIGPHTDGGRNPHYEGCFEDETPAQAEERRRLASTESQPQAETPLTEFCWLVELFEPWEGGNSSGFYHTGFTDLMGHSRTTSKPYEAKRYASKEQAERVAAGMMSKRGVWKAVEHGFNASTPLAHPNTGAHPPEAEPTYTTLGISDEEIDLIAADGMRDAAGGIYATRVYEFAWGVEKAVLARWHAASEARTDAGAYPRKVTGEMVNRFLGWKLPKSFSPDCGITFEPIGNKGSQYEYVREPTGTNLFDADQARVMLEHVLAFPPDAGWISVEDRLPEKFVEVLIAFKDCTLPATAQYTGNPHDIEGWCYPSENRGDGFDWTVTHWMPLPLTPTELAASPLPPEAQEPKT